MQKGLAMHSISGSVPMVRARHLAVIAIFSLLTFALALAYACASTSPS